MPPLAERVEQAVAAAVAARNGELEQVVREFVRQAVDAELERLVELEPAAELDQRSNGAGDDGPARADTAAEVSARELERPARLCSDCGREPVLEGRRIGRACKTARDRERVRRREAAADDDAEDRPAGIAPYLLAARANHRGGPRLSPDEPPRGSSTEGSRRSTPASSGRHRADSSSAQACTTSSTARSAHTSARLTVWRTGPSVPTSMPCLATLPNGDGHFQDVDPHVFLRCRSPDPDATIIPESDTLANE